jgi:predicted 2-oxoglutarate/Fe(II)-dependent dioxygenase YbiX
MTTQPHMSEYFVIPNFISPEDCTSLIEFINSLPEEDFIQKRDGRLTIANADLETSNVFLNKYTPKVQALLTSNHQIRTFFLAVYPVGAGIEPHIDEPVEDVKLKDDIGVVYFLNEEFTGGEIYLPDWDFTYVPKTGDAVFFPINRYMHGVNPVTSGIRYAVPLQYSAVPGEALEHLVIGENNG